MHISGSETSKHPSKIMGRHTEEISTQKLPNVFTQGMS